MNFCTKNKNRLIRSLLFLIVVFLPLASIFWFNNQVMKNDFLQKNENDNFTPANAEIKSISFTLDYYFGRVNFFNEIYDVEGIAITNDSLGNSYTCANILFDFLDYSNGLIWKINNSGRTAWNSELEFNDYYSLADLAISTNETMIVYTGSIQKLADNNDCNLTVGCMNAQTGEIIWNTTFGSMNYDEKGSAIIVVNETVIVLGTKKINSSNIELFLTKFNLSNGTLQTNITLTSGYNHHDPQLFIEKNKLYVIYNRLLSTNSSSIYQYIIDCVTLNGSSIWSLTSGEETNVYLRDSYYNKEEQAIFLLAQIWPDGQLENKETIIDIYSLSGNLENQIDLFFSGRGSEMPKAIAVTSDFLFVSGESQSTMANNIVAFLTKIDRTTEKELFTLTTELFYESSINDMIINSADRLVFTGFCAYSYDLISTRGLFAISADSDGDFLSDFWEEDYGLDPFNPDTDGDGFTDWEEIILGSNPLDANDSPTKRRFWMDFGLVFFFVLIAIFIVIEIILWIMNQDTNNKEKTAIVEIFDRIITFLLETFKNIFSKKEKKVD